MPQHPFYQLLTDSLIPYSWSYIFPYLTISYATGQWFETAIWEKYHERLLFTQTEDIYAMPLHRVMMDLRPGAARWVYFFQGEGETWHTWDIHVFGRLGSSLVYFVTVVIPTTAYRLAIVWLIVWAYRRLRTQGKQRGGSPEGKELA